MAYSLNNTHFISLVLRTSTSRPLYNSYELCNLFIQSNVLPCFWMKKVKNYFASRIDIISSNGSFQCKSEFGYCSNGDRVNARGNAQIRATTHFLREE